MLHCMPLESPVHLTWSCAARSGFLWPGGSCVENWYGYTDSALCTECASTSMGRASLPLIFLVIIVILALVVFCRGGNLTCGVDLTMAMKEGFSETVEERASGAVEKKAVEETLTDDGSRFERAKTRKERASSLGLKVVAKGANFGVKLKILLSTIQILEGIVANFSIPFSSFYIAVVNSLSGVLQIDLPQLVPLDCISKTTYYSRLIVKCARPANSLRSPWTSILHVHDTALISPTRTPPSRFSGAAGPLWPICCLGSALWPSTE